MKIHIQYLFLFIFFTAVYANVSGQTIINITDRQVVLHPADGHWYKDISGRLSFNEIQKNAFIKLSPAALTDIPKAAILWTQFTLMNSTGSAKSFMLQVPKSGFATAYIQYKDSLHIQQTGSLLPLHQRALHINTNGFEVSLKNRESVQVWVSMQSIYSIYQPKRYTISVVQKELFDAKDKQRLLWQGIFLGVILVMVLYNMLIGFAVRDSSYLFYVLSIIGIGSYFAFYYGFGIEYLWPASPVWDTFCYLIIVPFSGLMRLLFTRTYLHTPRLLPKTNKLINGLLVLNLIVLLTGLISYIFKLDIIYPLVEVIGITGTVIHILMLLAGMVAYHNNFRPAKYFIWANLVLVIGAVLFIGRELGFLEDNFTNRYLVQIGFLIQVVVFSLGLASRLNDMRLQLSNELLDKERIALEREREKKELIEVQRRELLDQVEQQTKDLKQKNIQLEGSFLQVKESENKLGQLNEVKNKLFSVISHDLRNPLATMQSFLKLITEHHSRLSPDEKEKLFLQAQTSLDNLNVLMYNLLQWSRSQMNLLEYKAEDHFIFPVIESAVKAVHLNAHMKNIIIETEVPENYCINTDKEMTEFVLRNLLSNAIKFSHRNSKVTISVSQLNNEAVISVIDKGIGIHEAKIKKLLAFNSTTSRRGTEKEKGTGLGLLISKEFIEKNGGKLFIDSQVGNGSRFSFTIRNACILQD